MSWSIGEIRSLSVKATRGSGFSWGLAEEAGFAVSRLQSFGLPGIAALADYLQHIDDTGFDLSANPQKCPISYGANLSDTRSQPDQKVDQLRQPLLLVPFISHSSGTLGWNNAEVYISHDNIEVLTLSGDLVCSAADCTWSAGMRKGQAAENSTRVEDSELPGVEILERFASRTYAPATEESRLAGAGAGLNDND